MLPPRLRDLSRPERGRDGIGKGRYKRLEAGGYGMMRFRTTMGGEGGYHRLPHCDSFLVLMGKSLPLRVSEREISWLSCGRVRVLLSSLAMEAM